MAPLAVLSDVHGNLPALEAVLTDARARGTERFLLCGDYAAMGLWPRECVARLKALEPVAMLRGNHERWLTDSSDLPAGEAELVAAVNWERAQLGDALVAEQAVLPPTAMLGTTLFCHAAPQTDMVSFLPEPDPARDAQLLGDTTAKRVVFGHYHLQFRRTTPAGIELVGPGSVGLPCDGDQRAAYATIADDGELQLHRVAYDHEAVRAALLAGADDWAPWVAGIIERASF
jgi:predicted phosphodiesterase